MPRVIFHNKAKKKKGSPSVQFSFTHERRPAGDVTADETVALLWGIVSTSNTSNTTMTTGSDSMEFKVNNNKRIIAPDKNWQECVKVKPDSLKWLKDVLRQAERYRNLPNYKTIFLLSPARETFCFQSCVRLNKKQKTSTDMSDSDSTLIHSNGSKATRSTLPKMWISDHFGAQKRRRLVVISPLFYFMMQLCHLNPLRG